MDITVLLALLSSVLVLCCSQNGCISAAGYVIPKLLRADGTHW